MHGHLFNGTRLPFAPENATYELLLSDLLGGGCYAPTRSTSLQFLCVHSVAYTIVLYIRGVIRGA